MPNGNKYFLGFFVHPQAFCAVAALNVDETKHLLYGVGLASIVICSSERANLTSLVKKWKNDLRAHEIWEIADNIRNDVSLHLGRCHPLNRDDYQLPVEAIRDVDVRWLCLELGLNLRRFVELSSQYIPSNLPRCRCWTKALADVVLEILFIEALSAGSTAIPPTSLLPREVDLLRTQTFFRKQKLNANIDQLIHVNSSLVYAMSQAFYGSVPVHGSLPLVSQHSLLGVGSAWLALRNLCNFIEKTFEQLPVPAIILDQFPKLGWRGTNITPKTPRFSYKDDAIEPRCSDPVRPKITFFSSRLGFGESDFTVTCATQALHAASSPRYTPMTITHELLHAHVKSLLISIFTVTTDQNVQLPFEESLRNCIEQYLGFLRDKKADHLKLIHTLRFALLQFVVDYHIYSSKAKTLVDKTSGGEETDTLEISLPATLEGWVTAFRSAYRFLNEIMVHTLDLSYFYASQAELYIDSLWTSWECVPSITDKIEWYALRTLASVAITIDGEPLERFDKVKPIFKDRLLRLAQLRGATGVVGAVLDRLETSQLTRWLELLFIPSVGLADLTSKYLIDERIGQALRRDDGWVDWVDGKLIYLLPDMAFDEKPVGNPLVFVYDRLIKNHSTTETPNEGEEAARSAWMILALAHESRQRDITPASVATTSLA